MAKAAVVDNSPPPTWTNTVWTVRKLVENITAKVLQHNPTNNRSATVGDDANKKNIGIITSILYKYGLSNLIFRDITNSASQKAKYGKSYKFTVLEGGHRCRAIKWFMENRFAVPYNGQIVYWKDLDDDVREAFLNFEMQVSSVLCTNKQVREIFERINQVTAVTDYSIIMNDDDSKVVEFVRKMTRDWIVEYRTEAHAIFYMNKKGRPQFFKSKVENPGNMWDNMVFVVINKVLGKGNIDAGEKTSRKLVDKYGDTKELSGRVQKEVYKFWDTFLEVVTETKRSIDWSYFGAFQVVYFKLYEDYGCVPNFDVSNFARQFHSAYTFLADKKDKTTTIHVGDEDLIRSNYVYGKSYAFTDVDAQNLVAELIMERMNVDYYEV